MRSPFLLLAPLLTACDPPVVRFECARGEPLCEARLPAEGVDITGVAIYQATEGWIMVDGVGAAAEDLPAPLMAGRDALVRVFLDPGAGLEEPRALAGRLDVYDDGEFVLGVDAEVEIDGASSETDLATTLNFAVPGEALGDAAAIVVRVLDPDATEVDEARVGRATWPEDGAWPLPLADTGGLLRILLVPVEYQADGSGRLPDTSEEQIETYRDWFLRTYPVREVEIDVADTPFEWDRPVTAGGSGWDTLLSAISGARDTYGAEDDQYLYGAFEPASSMSEFCAAGCVSGLSNMAMSPGDVYSRASIGLGYTGESAATTAIHEVGHAHGRYHAPGCGAQGTDPGYPNETGRLDVRGYDPGTDALMEPDEAYDFMSYCAPYWVSAYGYAALFDRVAAVDELYGLSARGRVERWGALLARADGGLEWLPDRRMRGAPGPLREEIELLGPDGGLVAVEGAWWTPFDHVDAGVLSFPLPDGVDVRGARWAGREAWR